MRLYNFISSLFAPSFSWFFAPYVFLIGFPALSPLLLVIHNLSFIIWAEFCCVVHSARSFCWSDRDLPVANFTSGVEVCSGKLPGFTLVTFSNTQIWLLT